MHKKWIAIVHFKLVAKNMTDNVAPETVSISEDEK
jgi:hypothetical protein